MYTSFHGIDAKDLKLGNMNSCKKREKKKKGKGKKNIKFINKTNTSSPYNQEIESTPETAR